MGNKYVSSDISALISALTAQSKAFRTTIDSLSTPFTALIGDVDDKTLAGKTWDGVSSVSQEIFQVAFKNAKTGLDQLDSEISTLKAAQEAISFPEIDEDKALDSLSRINMTIVNLEVSSQDYSNSMIADDARDRLPSMYAQRDQIGKALQEIYDFMYATNNLFEEPLAIIQNAVNLIQQIQGGGFDKNGQYLNSSHYPMNIKQLSQDSIAMESLIEKYKNDPEMFGAIVAYNEQFGLSPATSELLAELPDKIRKEYPNLSDQDQAYLLSLLLAKITGDYSGWDWDNVSGSLKDAFGDDDVSIVLKKLGYSSSQIKSMKDDMQNQHNVCSATSVKDIENIYKKQGISSTRAEELFEQYHGKADLAHLNYTLACNLHSPNWLAEVGADGKAQDAAGWLGDTSTVTRILPQKWLDATPNMGNDDYKADLDAVNIAERIKSGGSYQGNMTQYYSELSSGETTRAKEFTTHHSVQSITETINAVDGTGQMTSTKPIKYDNSKYDDLNPTAKKFVDSLKAESNDLL